MPLDVDEFVNIKKGNHKLDDLHAALPDADAITLTWRLFGNNGIVRFEDKPVLDQFTKCAPEVMYWPWRAAMFKTLYRNSGAYKKLGVHRPRDADDALAAQTRWFDGEGRELDRTFRMKRIFSNFGRSNTSLVQLNHYPLGSMESYVMKADRGRAVHSDDILGLDYWVERNFNQEEDTSIQALAGSRQAELDAFMADETLSNLHHTAVAWRKSHFDKIMLQDPYRALMGRLLMAAPTRLIPQQAAQFLMSYATRATKKRNT